MGAQAKFSVKGQIVIPKDVRERYRFADGQIVDVVETPDGVLLRTPVADKRESFDGAIARIRSAISYTGPRLDDAAWRQGLADSMRDRWQDG